MSLTREQQHDFYETICMAELVFPDGAVESLRSVLENIAKCDMASRMALRHEERGDESARQLAIDQEIAAQSAVWDALPNLVKELVNAARIDIAYYPYAAVA